jgi:hypothetical protein
MVTGWLLPAQVYILEHPVAEIFGVGSIVFEKDNFRCCCCCWIIVAYFANVHPICT